MKPATTEVGRFIVTCSLQYGSRAQFDRGLHAAGSIMPLGDKVWLLCGAGTAGSVRNQLLQYVGPRDILTVIQFEPKRTATHNVGPEMDARLRAMLYLEGAVTNVANCA
jgi:hypothetical protein